MHVILEIIMCFFDSLIRYNYVPHLIIAVVLFDVALILSGHPHQTHLHLYMHSYYLNLEIYQ